MSETKSIEEMIGEEYKHGFVTDIEYEHFPHGVTEETVRLLSEKRNEPEWMTEFRLKAYNTWKKMVEPTWFNASYEKIDFDELLVYAAPKEVPQLDSLDDMDPEIRKTWEKLGIPIEEQKAFAGVAVDAIFDSVSIFTSFKDKLLKAGVIFCSISEAIRDYPELIQKYLGSVVPAGDNFYSALNSAVFSDGTFCFIPKDTECPMELSSYFRINNMNSGQFERTLIVAEERSTVSYLEGCTAPKFDNNQLHAAVVEIVALEDADVKYSTIQNWYPGDKDGKGGIYNFVTKRGICKGDRSKISWTQLETGAAVTLKYPSVILQGDDSVGEFYSVAVSTGKQQFDTGTKMLHIGKNTKSTIISKGISADESQNSYRGEVRFGKKAKGAKNYSVCDSMLIGDKCGAHTFPYISSKNPDSSIEHEASTSRVGEEQIFYLMQRGISEEDAVSMIINGFVKDVLKELPLEFAAEANALLSVKLEGSVG